MTVESSPTLAIVGCRSDGEQLAATAENITVIGDTGELRALQTDKRRELIASVRAGNHVELQVTARTFRQRDGSPNRNHLRFRADKLDEIAASFVGMPVLLDHDKNNQAARIGTIEASETVQQGHGWTAFQQVLRIVKPEAVISVLDGTLDRFSIGWHATGPVLCSVHRLDIRGAKSCACWPGDAVDLDGTKQIAEYEFQSAEGVETSGVNVPAVKGTKIDDVRAALALELNLSPQHRIVKPEEAPMKLQALEAAIPGGDLSTEAGVLAAARWVESIQRGKLAAEQERDTARTLAASLQIEVSATKEAALKVQVDAAIKEAYQAGKLRMGRDDDGGPVASKKEERLRRIAREDGLTGLAAELEEMPAVVPIGVRQLNESDSPRERGAASSAALASVAAQLGMDPDELNHYAQEI